MKLETRGHLLSFAIMIAVIVATTRCGVRDDELMCEEAVAALAECCPAADRSAAALRCSYHPGCIDQAPVYPVLTPALSECILSQECKDLEPECRRIFSTDHGPISCE